LRIKKPKVLTNEDGGSLSSRGMAAVILNLGIIGLNDDNNQSKHLWSQTRQKNQLFCFFADIANQE
jgi:hypothetical protein